MTIAKNYSYYALTLLLIVNLLNYIDRQVLYAVFPLVKADLRLSDTQLGFLGSAFMVCYMVAAPICGWLGDRTIRVKVASWGLMVWSLATGLSGLALGYRQLLAARTAVGVGEASFSTVSPSLLSDYFPAHVRGRILSCFYLAIPVGSALGYLLGGILGQNFGWQAAFFMVGIPGLILVLPLWVLHEPERVSGKRAVQAHGDKQPETGYLLLLKNRSFITNTLAMSAMTFALGGLAQWTPTFLFRMHGLDVEKANTLFGIVTICAGITGTLIGGWLGDLLQKRNDKGYLLVSGWGFLIGIPFTVYALVTPLLLPCMIAMFFAEFFIFFNTGPLNTVIVNVIPPAIRSMAFAVNIFFIHLLGDAISPTILGWLSDRWGLRNAMLITPMVIVFAAFFCFFCTRYIKNNTVLQEG